MHISVGSLRVLRLLADARHLALDPRRLFKVLLLHRDLLLRLELLELDAHRFEPLDLVPDALRMLVVFVLDGYRLVHLQLAQFNLSVRVEQVAHAGMVRGRSWVLLAVLIHRRAGLCADLRHARLIHHVHRLLVRQGTAQWPDAVERHQTNLVLQIELVVVILVEEQLEKRDLLVDRDGLELARLEPRSLVRVKREEAELLELDLVEGQPGSAGWHRVRVERKQFDLAGDFGLVR